MTAKISRNAQPSQRGGRIKFPDRTDRGKVDIRSWKNVAAFLDCAGTKVRRNEFTGVDEVDGKPLNDDVLVHLMDRAHRAGLRVNRDFLLDRLKATALSNQYHPVRDYFSSLKWDGEERIDNWMTKYLGVTATDFVRAVSAIVLIAAVRRVRKPGTKFDTMPVIEGPQGLGKSSALAALSVRLSWFTDCASLTHDSKTIIEQTSGKWIVEVPELNGMRRSEVEHVKANLSRTHDRARTAYARLASEVPRQFIMIGTINTDADGRAQYLKDHTGNRRFWPVLAHKIDMTGLKRNIDQLWAEACAREAKGESIVLAQDLWKIAAARQQRRMEANVYFDALKNEIGGKESGRSSSRTFGNSSGRRLQRVRLTTNAKWDRRWRRSVGTGKASVIAASANITTPKGMQKSTFRSISGVVCSDRG
jgi:predicted P-loop ATPase